MDTRRRGCIFGLAVLLVAAAGAFGAQRPFLYDRNELFDSWSEGQVQCAAASGGELGGRSDASPPEQAPDVREPIDAPCLAEGLKPWS